MTDIDKLFSDEIDAANAHLDAKEAALDAYGYGGGKTPVSPEQIVGLGDFVPNAVPAQGPVDWRAILRRVSCRPSLPALTFTLDESIIIARHDVTCNATGRRGIYHTRELPPVVNDEHAVVWLRSFIREIYEHEIDEAFLVDGKQLRDPHMAVNESCPEHAGCRVASVHHDGAKSMFRCVSDTSPRRWPRELWP